MMATALYFWLASKLGAWEDEPFSSCLGLCLFILLDVYLALHWVQEWMTP